MIPKQSKHFLGSSYSESFRTFRGKQMPFAFSSSSKQQPFEFTKTELRPSEHLLVQSQQRNTRAMFEICSKVAIKTLERRH